MSDHQPFLREVHIKNFLSLHDVSLPLKQLTVLVGPNASGKSNILNALNLLRKMMNNEKLPSFDEIQDAFWAGGADCISFQLQVQVDDTPTHYQLELVANHENPVRLEELFINKIKVISVRDGQGEVTDEVNGTNITPYRPLKPKLALKSAGDYGDRPVTGALNQFIQEWEFYNFERRVMRGIPLFLLGSNVTSKPNSLSLDDDGSRLRMILANWAEHDAERFELVNEALYDCANLKIDKQVEEDEVKVYLHEGYENPIPLEKASDGTLRLLAYYILLHQPDLPSLIAIEEPERKLHPGALRNGD